MAAVKALAGGASGFVDSRPCPALAETGHDAAATTRHPGYYNAASRPSTVTHDPATFRRPAGGGLLPRHAERRGLKRDDAGAAEAFGEAAARAGLTRSSTSDGSAGRCRHPAGTPAQPPRGREAARVRRGSRDCPAHRESSSGTAASRRSWARQLVEHLLVMVTPKPVSIAPSPSPPTAPWANSAGAVGVVSMFELGITEVEADGPAANRAGRRSAAPPGPSWRSFPGVPSRCSAG